MKEGQAVPTTQECSVSQSVVSLMLSLLPFYRWGKEVERLHELPNCTPPCKTGLGWQILCAFNLILLEDSCMDI